MLPKPNRQPSPQPAVDKDSREPLRPLDQASVAKISKESMERYRRHVSDVNRSRDREIETALHGF
jgi:hypothetical protein